MSTKTKIETEVKLEVSREEFVACQKKMSALGFSLKHTSALSDFFYNIEKFDEKGWDFTRIRVYDGERYEKTEKKWKRNEKSERIREEFESASSKIELEELQKEKEMLSLQKTRTDYSGKTFDYDGVCSFDEVTFPDETRYFIECEIEVAEELSDSIRPALKSWMILNFDLSDRPEGIGMMKLVLSKAGLI